MHPFKGTPIGPFKGAIPVSPKLCEVCKTLPMAVGLCRALATGSVGPEV